MMTLWLRVPDNYVETMRVWLNQNDIAVERNSRWDRIPYPLIVRVRSDDGETRVRALARQVTRRVTLCIARAATSGDA